MCEVLCSATEPKVAIIGDGFEGLREAFKIYVSILESFYDSKHLVVIDLIVAFSIIYRL
jgi:hypothetical protein